MRTLVKTGSRREGTYTYMTYKTYKSVPKGAVWPVKLNFWERRQLQAMSLFIKIHNWKVQR